MLFFDNALLDNKTLLDIDNRVCRIKIQERSGKIFVKVFPNRF